MDLAAHHYRNLPPTISQVLLICRKSNCPPATGCFFWGPATELSSSVDWGLDWLYALWSGVSNMCSAELVVALVIIQPDLRRPRGPFSGRSYTRFTVGLGPSRALIKKATRTLTAPPQAAPNAGFERMVAKVCLGKVAGVRAREVLHFGCDWQQLVEMTPSGRRFSTSSAPAPWRRTAGPGSRCALARS